MAQGIILQNKAKKWPPSTLIVWDVSALHAIAEKHRKQPAGEELERLWAALFAKEAPLNPQLQEGYARVAMFYLVAHPKEAVPFLQKKLPPTPDRKRLAQLIEDLDSPDFNTRKQATDELERAGHAAYPFLEDRLKRNPPPEMKRRLEELLNGLRPTARAYEVRMIRVIDVLEHIATPEARKFLNEIAQEAYGPSFAGAAKEALERLAKKRG